MTRQLLLIATTSLVLAGCDRGPTSQEAPPRNGTTVVFATTQCTVPNADGVRCDRKTCKEDARSSCASFSDRCTQSGHSYEGDDSAGTCIRGDQIG